jgi:hypothetical protein
MFRGILCASAALILGISAAGRAEFQVNTYTMHNQTHPSVAMNKAGDFVAAWRSSSSDGRGGGVYARCFDANGTPAGEEFKVNTSQVDVDNWTPAVGIDPDGGFVVAWVSVQDSDCDIKARMFNRQGEAITEEFKVNESTSKTGQSMPGIAMSATGKFVVVWTDWSGGCYAGKSRVLGRVFEPDGTPSGGEFVVSDNTNADWSDIGMDDSGRFVVAWIRMGDTYSRPYGEYIMFRRYEADGTPAGGAVQVTSDVNCRWYGPAVAVDSSGEFVVTWAVGPFPYDIVAQYFTADGIATTQAYMVNTSRENNQGHPRIAGNGRGQYLIVWDSQEQDGSYSGVFGQRCKQGGELVDTELQVNSLTEGRQWYADVAGGPDDHYVVVWISENQDGDGYGIFGDIVPR